VQLHASLIEDSHLFEADGGTQERRRKGADGRIRMAQGQVVDLEAKQSILARHKR
jgi:hypothetical protein